MDTRISDSKECKRYMQMSAIIGIEAKMNKIPILILEQYKEALSAYRALLDMLDFKMPLAKYPYDANDPSTHKYLDVMVDGRKINREFLRDIPNLTCRYKF